MFNAARRRQRVVSGPTMNAVIYVRVSGAEQVNGTSLESQLVDCREYATRKGWAIQREFVEKGESAKFVDRTELLGMMDYCKNRKNHVQVVLFWKLDRFTRNTT